MSTGGRSPRSGDPGPDLVTACFISGGVLDGRYRGMEAWFNKAFSAEGRKWIYGIAAAAVLLLSGYGLLSDSVAPLWLSLVGAVLWALGNITAILHTDSKGRMALYGVALAILALLVGYGVVDEGQAGMWGALAAALFGVGTNALARTKVTPKVVEGEVEHGSESVEQDH